MSRAARGAGLLAAALPALLLAGAPGCQADQETEVVHGTAVDHGAALFNDPSIAGTGYNAFACSTCHAVGAAGEGDSVRSGAPLNGVVERPSYWGGDEVDLLRSINLCLYYFMLRDAPLKADDEDARALYAYLESLPSGPADAEPVPFTVVRTIEDLPPGDASRGAGVYDRACLTCHGVAGTGEGRIVERAPVLPQQTLEEHPAGEYTELERRLVFVEKIRHGGFYGYGGQMPPLSLEKLSDAEVGDLLTFFGIPRSP